MPRPQAPEVLISILPRETVAAGLREAARIRAGAVPGAAELANAPLLTGWAVQPMPGGLVRLVGFASGHPLLQDGCITTSAILAADEQAGWVRTVSRYYRLGPRLGEVQQCSRQ
ncbi:hypothetical protein FF80_01924 [Devosia sp. LC5]|uniref:DUF6634 family protein n=1 Tax=Devosia sp. LC5 TaxID=1502724 RepID=UPI0004E2F2A7|nr:DUF6634 family protein [Devosia sp. LC5]KFC68200.1 hypothetical protein FF80_01924 [Devosia sp. LC5]